LFTDERYQHRIFCTSPSGPGPAHKIISEQDKRADVENLVGEAKREGLDAIHSAKSKTNYVYFNFHVVIHQLSLR
jgi:hypothetical protein